MATCLLVTYFAKDEAGSKSLVSFLSEILSLREALSDQDDLFSELPLKKQESKDYCDILRQITKLEDLRKKTETLVAS